MGSGNTKPVEINRSRNSPKKRNGKSRMYLDNFGDVNASLYQIRQAIHDKSYTGALIKDINFDLHPQRRTRVGSSGGESVIEWLGYLFLPTKKSTHDNHDGHYNSNNDKDMEGIDTSKERIWDEVTLRACRGQIDVLLEILLKSTIVSLKIDHYGQTSSPVRGNYDDLNNDDDDTDYDYTNTSSTGTGPVNYDNNNYGVDDIQKQKSIDAYNNYLPALNQGLSCFGTVSSTLVCLQFVRIRFNQRRINLLFGQPEHSTTRTTSTTGGEEKNVDKSTGISHIEELVFDSCQFLGDDTHHLLANYLALPGISSSSPPSSSSSSSQRNWISSCLLKKITLRRCFLSDEQMATIIRNGLMIGHAKTLTHLNLEHSTCQSETMTALGELLVLQQQLQEQEEEQQEGQLLLLSSSSSKRKIGLQSLDLSCQRTTFPPHFHFPLELNNQVFIDGLSTACRYGQLSTLYLERNDITPDNLSGLAEALRNNVQLRLLDIQMCDLSSHSVEIQQLMDALCCDNDTDDDDDVENDHNNDNVTSNAPTNDPYQLSSQQHEQQQQQRRVCSSTGCTLEELYMAHSRFSKKSLMAISSRLSYMPNLRVLDLSGKQKFSQLDIDRYLLPALTSINVSSLGQKEEKEDEQQRRRRQEEEEGRYQSNHLAPLVELEDLRIDLYKSSSAAILQFWCDLNRGGRRFLIRRRQQEEEEEQQQQQQMSSSMMMKKKKIQYPVEGLWPFILYRIMNDKGKDSDDDDDTSERGNDTEANDTTVSTAAAATTTTTAAAAAARKAGPCMELSSGIKMNDPNIVIRREALIIGSVVYDDDDDDDDSNDDGNDDNNNISDHDRRDNIDEYDIDEGLFPIQDIIRRISIVYYMLRHGEVIF